MNGAGEANGVMTTKDSRPLFRPWGHTNCIAVKHGDALGSGACHVPDPAHDLFPIGIDDRTVHFEPQPAHDLG